MFYVRLCVFSYTLLKVLFGLLMSIHTHFVKMIMILLSLTIYKFMLTMYADTHIISKAVRWCHQLQWLTPFPLCLGKLRPLPLSLNHLTTPERSRGRGS